MQLTQPENGKGCYTAEFPSTAWREVPCVPAPNIPMVPRSSAFVVGNTDDVSAQAPSGTITQTIGRFENISNVTSETGLVGNSGTPVNDAYSLQVNTNFMTSTACAGSPNTGCQGWEQFVFLNNGSSGSAFIQYWLIKFNATCPAGWNQFQFTGQTDIYCFRNDSAGAVAVPNQVITNIGNWTLSGTATSTGDSVSMGTGTSVFATNGDNSVNAAAGWIAAEFNVFGAGGSSAGGGQANFNAGASLNTRTQIVYGGNAAPTCLAQGFTGETNNLNFGPSAPVASSPGPAIVFQESTAGGATSNCAASSAVGDPHLQTFAGLLYDFQAFGDFVLAETEVATPPPPPPPPPPPAPPPGSPGSPGPRVPGGTAPQESFLVQTRQVSGAPTFPDVAVNSAVATRMGDTTVALCLPGRLVVDGEPAEVEDGGTLLLPNGKVTRTGNSFLIRSQSGDSVRAVVNASWIDVSVGLGMFPTAVHGLLANANGNVNQIATRDGTVLTNPFLFDQLYGPFADSWRVPAKESLLSVCDERAAATGVPARVFNAGTLDPRQFRRGLAVCEAAGVKVKSLLEACILDVAVLGGDAAKVYVGAPAPAAVGLIVMRHDDHHHHHRHHHHGFDHDHDDDDHDDHDHDHDDHDHDFDHRRF